VASLAQPGGNLTGVTNLGTELGPKRLELLHELVPVATSFAVLVNPTYPDAAAQSEAAQAAARARSLRMAARTFGRGRVSSFHLGTLTVRRREGTSPTK
jgi:ABC-type uncharacterized transport system substrate-binding protein